MNERIKQLRTTLGLSGEKFGEKIGIKRAAISKIENSSVGLSEQNIKSICREYNVNEQWLRTGEGEMFNSLDTIDLDDLASEMSDEELEILKLYFSIDKDVRQKALKYFVDNLKKDKSDEAE